MPISILCAVPTEYVDGEWRHPIEGSKPDAIIAVLYEPDPITGRIFRWQAAGKTGLAFHYFKARKAAELALRNAHPGEPQ